MEWKTGKGKDKGSKNVATPGAAPAGSAGLPDGDDDLERAAKDRILRDATDAYQRNEFEDAQGKLDELRQRGLEDEDADRLQSNLDVVNADDGEEIEGAAAVSISAKSPVASKRKAGIVRRVREQAKARAGKKVSDERDHRDRAKRLRAQGKYDEAANEYRKALKANKDLKKLEQDESTVYDYAADEIEDELEEVETESKQAEAMQKLVDPAWLSIGEPAEHGFGAAMLVMIPRAMPAAVSTGVPPTLDDGPHVILPIARTGDTIVYRFDLWAEGTRHALVVHARRRLELPPP
jgi:tetratricopeptide (TPR) repeat protein